MTTTAPYPTASKTTAPKPRIITRLVSVEEELTDRICRSQNGDQILPLCNTISEMLIETYATNDGDIAELRDMLKVGLVNTLKCPPRQIDALIDLSLELIHTRLHDEYRPVGIDINVLIEQATDLAVCSVNFN